jgi:hypothetical protein
MCQLYLDKSENEASPGVRTVSLSRDTMCLSTQRRTLNGTIDNMINMVVILQSEGRIPSFNL